MVDSDEGKLGQIDRPDFRNNILYDGREIMDTAWLVYLGNNENITQISIVVVTGLTPGR